MTESGAEVNIEDFGTSSLEWLSEMYVFSSFFVVHWRFRFFVSIGVF
jgi:hypothetical protein